MTIALSVVVLWFYSYFIVTVFRFSLFTNKNMTRSDTKCRKQSPNVSRLAGNLYEFYFNVLKFYY